MELASITAPDNYVYSDAVRVALWETAVQFEDVRVSVEQANSMAADLPEGVTSLPTLMNDSTQTQAMGLIPCLISLDG